MATIAELRDICGTCSQETVALGDDLLVSLFGGRVIGLSTDGTENALWTNPALASVPTAAAMFADAAWPNPGGDRIWVSPERETHLIDPDDVGAGFAIPTQVDPGSYRVLRSDSRQVCLENSATVQMLRSKSAVALTWQTTISTLDDAPYATGDLAVRGYRTAVSMTCEGDPVVRPAIWRLLQVKGGGRITVPTRNTAAPFLLVGTAGYRHDGRLIHADIPAAASYKFAIHARESTGELRYQQDYAGYSDLIVRRFHVEPDGLYSEVPADGRPDTGYIVQIYVDDGSFGDFGELEHHSIAIPPGRSQVTDTCDTWLIRGDRQAIHALAAEMAEAAG